MDFWSNTARIPRVKSTTGQPFDQLYELYTYNYVDTNRTSYFLERILNLKFTILTTYRIALLLETISKNDFLQILCVEAFGLAKPFSPTHLTR